MFVYDDDEFNALIKWNKWHITESYAHGAFTIEKLNKFVNERTKRQVISLLKLFVICNPAIL